jgi:uncharacterized Fe-S cluster-containing MiaB family protein
MDKYQYGDRVMKLNTSSYDVNTNGMLNKTIGFLAGYILDNEEIPEKYRQKIASQIEKYAEEFKINR